MAEARISYEPPADALAAGVIILRPELLPSTISLEHWQQLPESLLDLVSLELEERNVLETLSDLCFAGFAAASVRGRKLETPTGAVSRLYLRLYLFAISIEQSKNLISQYHMLDMREKPRKLRISVALPAVLSYATRDPLSWQGQGSGSYRPGSMFFEQYSDNRSLSEIFQDLPSPALPPIPTRLPLSDPDRLLCEAMTWAAPPGMRTKLFPYQRRTVWRMLSQEFQPGTWADPRYVRVDSMDDGRPWYLDLYTSEIRTEEDVSYDRVKGGILCEEMGSGKTAMCIAVCLATKGRVAAPPNTPQASQPLTKDSMSWPGIAEQLPYNNLTGHQAAPEEAIPQRSFPSLRQMAQFVASTSSTCLDRTLARMRALDDPSHVQYFQRVMEHFDTITEQAEAQDPGSTIPFYLETEAQGSRRATREASKILRPAARIWLSALTLILVPNMIHQQWNAEILKHTQDGALRVLSVPTRPVADLPSPDQLIRQYDIILMTHERFALESMPVSGRRSPLLDIRFQRLIIDEGHVANAENNRLKDLGLRLNVDSRWIVTGTPTRNIKGLRMGAKAKKSEVPAGVDVVNRRLEMLLGEDAPPQTSPWSRSRDSEDLRRLGNMFEFLKVPPFIGRDAEWNSVVAHPLLTSGGPQFGAVQRLLRCLEGVLIRHRAEDIEQDVPLPELKEELVILAMTEHSALTHNALLAQIAINAVDSERKDQDYLFHPRNRASLSTVIHNLSQSLFWHTDNETDHAERVRTAIKSLDTAKKRGASEEDIRLVEAAIEHLSRARDDDEWRTVMDRIWLPFKVENLPMLMYSWVRSASLVRKDGSCLLEPERISHMRGFAGLHQKDMEDNNLDSLSALGHVYNRFDAELSAYVENLKQFRQNRLKAKPRAASPSTDGEPQEAVTVMEVQTSTTIAGSPARASTKAGKGKHGTRKEPPAPVLVDPEYEVFRKSYPRDIHNAGFSSETPLTQANICSSLSSKVNYILSDVLQYSPSEKIIIFSASSLSLSHLTEAFELYRIRFLHFHNALSVKDRENTIKTFETSDVYRVLLMELKHGARGLNLVSASRVYFCEPVWRADEEAQAIKRCHRIGQTRPVTVKTLVIRGTAEEEAVRIRNAHPDDQTKQMVDDVNIKHFIERPRFLEGKSVDWPTLQAPLLRVRTADEEISEPLSALSMSPISSKKGKKRARVEIEDACSAADATLNSPAPRRKQKKARFIAVSLPSPSPSSDDTQDTPSTPMPSRGARFADTALLSPPQTPLSALSQRAKAAFAAFSRSSDFVAPATPLGSPLAFELAVNDSHSPSTSSAMASTSALSPPPEELYTSSGSRESTPLPVTPPGPVFAFAGPSSFAGPPSFAGPSSGTLTPIKSALKRPRHDDDNERPIHSGKRARFGTPPPVTFDGGVEIDHRADDAGTSKGKKTRVEIPTVGELYAKLGLDEEDLMILSGLGMGRNKGKKPAGGRRVRI